MDMCLAEPILVSTDSLLFSVTKVALFLSGNDITGLLPTEIGLLTNLGKLLHMRMRDESLTSVVNALFCTNAVNTQMMVNWSGTIPSEIGGLTGLRKLLDWLPLVQYSCRALSMWS